MAAANCVAQRTMILPWHTTCTCFSRHALLIRDPIRQGSIRGKGISNPWESPARSYIRVAGKMERWCELNHAVPAAYEHETWQNGGQPSRPGSERPPDELPR